MPLITEYYGIAGPVPFADVRVLSDNLIFLDPHAVRLTGSPAPYATEAIKCVDTFFDEILRCVISGKPPSKRGKALLQHFPEPWETRFGTSAKGFHGKGSGLGRGTLIWDALTTDLLALVRVGVLKHLEELPMFVEGVDRDITSDVATLIMFGPLARFTESMVRNYLQFAAGRHPAERVICQVWDPAVLEWRGEKFTLPMPAGDPLLLVPKAWARRTLLMSATRFHRKTVLDFAQIEQAVVGSDGKPIKTPKDRLMKQTGFHPGRDTNIRLTIEARNKNQNLVKDFKDYVALKFNRTDEDTVLPA